MSGWGSTRGPGSASRRIYGDVDVLAWRPGLFEYFVADGEAPRAPAYIQQ